MPAAGRCALRAAMLMLPDSVAARSGRSYGALCVWAQLEARWPAHKIENGYAEMGS